MGVEQVEMPAALGLEVEADLGGFGGMEEKQGGEEDACEKMGLGWLVEV